MRWRKSTESATTSTPTVLNPRAAFFIAVTATAFALVATGCASSTNPVGDKAVDNALSKVDPCSIMKTEKAAQAGLPSKGEPDNEISSQPGCYYNGDYAGIGIYRISDDTLDELGKRSVWKDFERLKINNRDGAEAHQRTAAKDQCTTAISAGGGVVVLQVHAADPRKPFDACAEGLKVAELIEPDLPK